MNKVRDVFDRIFNKKLLDNIEQTSKERLYYKTQLVKYNNAIKKAHKRPHAKDECVDCGCILEVRDMSMGRCEECFNEYCVKIESEY